VSRRAEIEAALERLKAARSELIRRPAAEVIESLCETFEAWRRPDSRVRRELESRLPKAVGFAPPMLREGLDLALDAWSGDSLRALVAEEIGDLAATLEGTRRLASGFPVVSVLLAGSIPMPSLLASLLPLVVGSTTLVKPASRDLVTPSLVKSSLADVDPMLARCIEVVPFDPDDAGASESFFSSPCVVATGSDETLSQIARRVKAPQRLVAHGHRVSVAVIGPEALASESSISSTARALARDVALWDQLGCLSAIAVHLLDEETSGGSARAGDLAAALAEALADLESRWPREEIDPGSAAVIASERAEAEMRAALGRPVVIHASPDTRWSVILEADATSRPVPLHRFIRLIPSPTIGAMLEAMRPISPILAGVALAGFGDRERELGQALLDMGASRLCLPGRLQAPPLDWHRENRPVLLPMTRLWDGDCS
jgi:hypothetical protein